MTQPQTGLRKVVVFLPALNEEARVRSVIETVHTHYRGCEARGFEIQVVVVDDGSTDATVAEAQKAGVDRVVSHPTNLGLGAATRTGMETAHEMGADVAIKLDADSQHDPKDLENVFQVILRGEADIVYGSRFAGKIHYRMPIVRFVGNKFFTWLMRVMTGWKITDAQTGMMAYSKRYLAIFSMPGNYNPPQQTLLDGWLKGMRYKEVPVSFYKRTTGKSFVTFKYPLKVATQLLSVLMLTAPLYVFVPAGICLMGVGIAIGVIEYILLGTGYITDMHDSSIVLLVLFGIQSIFFGLLAELIKNTRPQRPGSGRSGGV